LSAATTTTVRRRAAIPKIESKGLPSIVLGMALFLSSESMFFAAMFGVYYTLRSIAPEWPPAGTPPAEIIRPALLTMFLVTSSLTQHYAQVRIRKDDRIGLARWTMVSILLGSLFIGGESWEWWDQIRDGFTIKTNAFGATFYTMTGFHMAHLFAGLVMLALIVARARTHSSRNNGPVDAVSYYWHFVDTVWIFLYFSFHLLPLPALGGSSPVIL
jgi:cytochrome c oxidase subunit III